MRTTGRPGPFTYIPVLFNLMVCLSPCSIHACPYNILGRVNCRQKNLLAVPSGIPAYNVTAGATFPTVTLDLPFNSISVLEHGVFSNLTSLQTLNIYNNRISSIQPGAFMGLENVTKLDLTSNWLESLTLEMLSGLYLVENLAFSYNDIAYMDENILGGFPWLRVLKLGSNKLTSLPSFATNPLENVEQLYLQYNRLSLVPSSTLNQLPNLTTLDLSGNQFTQTILQPFAGVPLLQSLQLNDIKTELSSHFTGSIFLGLQKLAILELSNNSMDAIPSNLSEYVPNLEQLSLQRNNLTQIPNNILSPLPKLTHLDFWFNTIQTIDTDAFSGLPMLNNLILSNNLLSTLPEGTFENIIHDAYVYLDSNPFSCDCRLAWLRDWYESSSVNRLFYPTCDKPSGLKTRTIPDVPSESFICVAPDIVQVTNDLAAVGEGTVTLHCNTTGFPAPVVSWTLPDGSTQTGSTIHVVTASPDSEGTYTCQASNAGGNDTLSIVLSSLSLSPQNKEFQFKEEITSISTFTNSSLAPAVNIQNVSRGSSPVIGIVFGTLASLIIVIMVVLAFTCHKGDGWGQTSCLHQKRKNKKAERDQEVVITLEDVEITPTGEENIYSTPEEMPCPVEHSSTLSNSHIGHSGLTQTVTTENKCATDHHYEIVPSTLNHRYGKMNGKSIGSIQPGYNNPDESCRSVMPKESNSPRSFRAVLTSPINHGSCSNVRETDNPRSLTHGKMVIPDHGQNRPTLPARVLKKPSENCQSGFTHVPVSSYPTEPIYENIQEDNLSDNQTSRTPLSTRYTIPFGYHSVASETTTTWPKPRNPRHKEDLWRNTLPSTGRGKHSNGELTIPGSRHYSPSSQNRQQHRHLQMTLNVGGGLVSEAGPIPTGNAPRKPEHSSSKFRAMAHMLTNTEGGRKVLRNPSKNLSNKHDLPDEARDSTPKSKPDTKEKPKTKDRYKSERAKAGDQKTLQKEREPLPAGLVMSVAKSVKSFRTGTQTSDGVKPDHTGRSKSVSKPWY
ncbi:PREDICTED: leucine-rich repeat and immunoglobulin-like domain-containing nogo receptor-interacting protein 2 [Branchiostoma belcheri]|uniref:Leucine-rich repeat and immunoglobulin-like domain-containing nogo receptor-interacting protein 2 n=1 Tax=Branchiostoma belcheri TaxID=7741 RepID=A0A6P4XYM2_BRABE|nr:PREDICTED: leucine-rich repeat and immunoglobulin-like domain-containing nogo receptor-interacting protein 2 [Branchiostoma belcheri]